MTQRMTVKAVFALLCLVCLGAVSVRAESQHEEGRRIVRQVDHIVIRVDSAADTQALWSLFSEKLKLPIAWPPGDYGDFFSGGVSVGNVNLEFAYLSSRWEESHATPPFHTRAQLYGFGLEPTPLTVALSELERRGLHYGPPQPYQIKGRDGSTKTLWTQVDLPDVSRQMNVFLCEYNPIIWQMSDPPHRDIDEARRALRDALRERDGGPAGIVSVKEILIGASDYKATSRRWLALLGPTAAELAWQPGGGPAIRFAPAPADGIQSIVIRVASLEGARRFLQANGLLGQSTKTTTIAMDPNKLMGINVQLVE
jgi:hypothetical protein